MLADPSRTGYLAVALPEEMPVNETIDLEARLREAVGLGLDAIVVNGMWPRALHRRTTSRSCARPRATAAAGAVRAALSAHERVKAQRAQLRRLEAGTDAPVSTLPFVFESELELDHYRTLSEALLRE